MYQRMLTRAIELAADARRRGDEPFGALLAVDGRIVAEARNRVNTDADLTAHAELALVRAVEAAGLVDQLAVGTVFTSCEPCPMCVGALVWAGSRHIVFALSAARLRQLVGDAGIARPAFTVSAPELAAQATPAVVCEGPFDEEAALAVHQGFRR